MKKIALIIMIITLVSKFLGFGRELVLSYFFGASNISDAYLISLTVPDTIFGLIAFGIATAYIPIQSKILNDHGNHASSEYTSNFINIVLLLVSIVFVFAMMYTPYVVKVFAIGFQNEILTQTVIFTRITLVGIFFTVLITVFTGYLQVKNNFVIPALIGFPLNVIVISAIFIASKGNYNALAIGTLLGTISQFIFMIPFIKKEKFKYKFILDFKDEHIKKTFHMALPIIIGISVYQVNVLVDRTIASTMAIGGISALNYANKLTGVVNGLFVASIVTVMYPTISKYASQHNYDMVKKSISETINLVSLLVVPITTGTLLFSDKIVRLLYGRGAFDMDAIHQTSVALFFYALGIYGIGLMDILTRGFYSIQNSKTPLKIGAIGVLLNIILNIILSRYLGIGGLALATSISSTVTAVLLLVSFRKKIGPFGMKNMVITFVKVLVASLIMGVIAKLSFNYFGNIIIQNYALLATIAISAVSYFAVIYFMKIEDVDVIIKTIKKRIQSKLKVK